MFDWGKHKLPDDFFRGSCDVHCHLLPGVDDGFATAEKSLQALKKLEERGVEKMILTPHFMKDYPLNDRTNITSEFETFKAVAEKSCKIELRLAAEYMLDARFMEHYKEGFLTLSKTGKQVLCETSYMMYEPGISEMLYDVMCDDYNIVIAHPERYEYAVRDNYLRWKDKGFYFQLNLLSLSGAYGKAAVVKSHYLLKEGMYDYVGSDMHGLENFKRFLPHIRLSKKNIDRLGLLLENNKKLFD